MATYLTGDCHGDLTKIINFVDRLGLNSEDNIIILGDAGLCWRRDKRDLEYNSNLWSECGNGVKLFFVDGNHENFDLLYSFPIENGIRPIAENIFHLPRGTVHTFENKKVLVCGGADSIDKYRRTKHLSWWEEETISKSDIEAISATHYDYVLTHTCPRSVFEANKVYLCTLTNIDQDSIEHDSEDMLELLKQKISYDHLYFGHFHVDKKLDDKHTCLFNDFLELK